eukprot:Nk52_evm87s226 gene=Nk52_evmTU87s226
MPALSKEDKRCLVIGGCGFLGQHLAEDLLSRGYSVSVFDVRKSFENDKISFFIGDLRAKEDLVAAMRGCYCVFNCASPFPNSNNRELFYAVNVEGTKNIVEACKEADVNRLVLTSSASVSFEGIDLKNADENVPYAAKPIDYYTETKILQEKIVLGANNGDTLFTAAIRPHSIFGPRDMQMIPTIVDTARRGKMKLIIGDGNNLVDFTYVKNVVHGHILAMEHLDKGSPANGQAFHITNDDPMPFWDFMSLILVSFGYPAPSIKVPYLLIYYIALLVEFCLWVFSPIVSIRPTFTPMRVALAATHHYYNCTKAKKLLNYKPLFTVKEGVAECLKFYTNLHRKEDSSSSNNKAALFALLTASSVLAGAYAMNVFN